MYKIVCFELKWQEDCMHKFKNCGSNPLEHVDDMSEKDKNSTLYLNVLGFLNQWKFNQSKINGKFILSPCKPKKFSKLFGKHYYYKIFHQLIFPSTNYLKNIILHACIKMQRGTVVHFICILHNTKNVFEILHHSCSSLWPLCILLDH